MNSRADAAVERTERRSFKLASNGFQAWWIVIAALAAVVLPTYWELAQSFWSSEDQGHGPIILSVTAWLLWRKREVILAAPVRPRLVAGSLLLAISLFGYVVGRSQGIITLEVLALIPIYASVILLLRGFEALKASTFALFFLIFMVPLPGLVVQMITIPLKSAVSHVAEIILYHAGYPIGRSGVILTIGQYQLLVADACAGLNSMFTLESLGLLYMNLMNYTSVLRNGLLAALIIPISFVANVVRVMILVLVTYYFGDAAGQGFVHGFAGMVLFMVALCLMIVVDSGVGAILKRFGR